MLDRFNDYIKCKGLFNKTSSLIVAVSGGIDSVCLCHLLYLSEYNFAIAHCNFGLRGQESDMDEEFVKELAVRYQVPFFGKSFDTTGFSKQHGVSTQMAARSLRYQWFEELLVNQQADKVLTAHHLDDSIETFFLNLTRGTGIAGLHGIQAQSGILARPLLFATREDIKMLADTYQLEWREDSSNKSIKYKRNFLRHNIIPLFSKLNPDFTNTLAETIEKVTLTESVFSEQVESFKNDILKQNKECYSISIDKLNTYKHVLILLYEVLKTFRFNFEQCKTILNSLDSGSGKKFISTTHVLVKDRRELIITPAAIKTDAVAEIIHPGIETLHFQSLSLHLKTYSSPEYAIKSDTYVAALDLQKLHFPLTVRSWQKGDYFQPLGMKGTKKVSDFLINNKVPLNLKDNICVLVSGETIVWIIGLRIDDRFKVTSKTNHILEIHAKTISANK